MSKMLRERNKAYAYIDGKLGQKHYVRLNAIVSVQIGNLGEANVIHLQGGHWFGVTTEVVEAVLKQLNEHA